MAEKNQHAAMIFARVLSSPSIPSICVKTWKPDTLRCLAGTEKAWFKFVVACEDDVRAVLRRASEADIPPERILIMPLASTQDELNAMRAQTVEWCLRYGLRFSDRLHIAIWDSKKGV